MTDTLDTIMRLGARLQDLKDQLDGKETEVSELKEQIRQLEESDIPQLMDERGLEEMRLQSGKRIKVGDFIQARIKHTKKPFNGFVIRTTTASSRTRSRFPWIEGKMNAQR